MQRYPIIVYWDGNEHLRDKLIDLATALKESQDGVSHVEDRAYFNTVMGGMKGQEVPRGMKNHVDSFKTLMDFIAELCEKHHISIELVEHISSKIIGTGHPKVIERLDANLARVRKYGAGYYYE